MKIYRLRNLILFLPNKFFSKVAPVIYAKKRGVKMNGKVSFYGVPKLGTEPWLITMGQNVHITKNVEFITHDGGTLLFRNEIPDLDITKGITIGDNVYIGINTIIMPGVNIGNNCIIGAGSIVTKNVLDGQVVAGNPAKFIKTTQEYLEKIKKESTHLGHLSGFEKEKKLKILFEEKFNVE